MDSSFQIGNIWGIPIKLHWTFVVGIFWVAIAFGIIPPITFFGKTYGFGSVEPASIKWIYSFAFATLLFICVAVHELGHSYVARRYNIGIRSITLYLFGGVSAMEEIPRNPRLEFRMAVVGPLVSGLLGVISFLIYIESAMLLGTEHPLSIFLWTLAIVNIILMVFNLLPAFPMDGGRVLRAWFATRMPYVIATRRAAGIGKMFAILMVVLGIFSLNVLLLLIAFFIYIGASEEERATTVGVCLEGVKVKNIMSSDVHTVTPDTSLKDLLDLMFREKHRGYPVVENESLRGIVTLTDVQQVPDQQRDKLTVGQIMNKNLYVISPDEEASSAVKMMAERGIRRIPVTENNNLVGIVSREDLVRAMELCSAREFTPSISAPSTTLPESKI
jgi:Zn-dependent protease/CBS domain-containing protein